MDEADHSQDVCSAMSRKEKERSPQATMQPLALRMPAVFDHRSFSHDDVRTQTRNMQSPPLELNSPPLPTSQRNDPASDPRSPDLNLPIMNPMNEPDYFNHFSPGTSETYITATPGGSQCETTTWHMTNIPYELDLDVYMGRKLDIKGTAECLEKAQSKFAKQSPGSNLHKEYQSKTFNRVVLAVAPNSSKQDSIPLPLKYLVEILGDEGLHGFFQQTAKYYETHFRIRDVSDNGRGRYVVSIALFR